MQTFANTSIVITGSEIRHIKKFKKKKKMNLKK